MSVKVECGSCGKVVGRTGMYEHRRNNKACVELQKVEQAKSDAEYLKSGFMSQAQAWDLGNDDQEGSDDDHWQA